MDKVLTYSAMVILIRVNMSMVNLMEEASIIGQLVLITLVTFTKERNRVEANGEVIGIYRPVTLMMVNTWLIGNMDKVFLLGPLETYSKETTLKMKEWETVKCFGLMVPCMKENG